jgi:sugar phosphate isomerase/epimerase
LIGLHLGARLTQPDQIEKEQVQIERVAHAVKGFGGRHLARLDAPAFIKKYGARIDGFHVRDYRGKQEAPMGQGEVDLRGLARALAETRWAGWVILEMNTMREIPSRDLAAGARAYMKKEMNF